MKNEKTTFKNWTEAELDAVLTDLGHRAWRPLQREALTSILEAHPTLVCLPTGGGKSFIYQAASRLMSQRGLGSTLVISPLIALMNDQVRAARERGLRAECVHSGRSRDERERALSRWQEGRLDLLFATPERFRDEAFAALLSRVPPALFVVDEVHCISTWGHDFRMDYSRLGEVRKLFPDTRVFACTASATPETRADCLMQLGLSESDAVREWRLPVWREELALSVASVHGLDMKVRAIIGLRHAQPGPAILYFALIETLEKASIELERLGIAHVTYHSRLGDGLRRSCARAFLGGTCDWMLATPAFGLGIDKPDIRSIIHVEIPGSLEALSQEVGRAGRDGAPAIATLLYDADDLSTQTDFQKWSHPGPDFIQSVWNLIDRNPVRARQEGFRFLRSQMNYYNQRDFRVETAVQWLERWGYLEGREPRQWKTLESPEFSEVLRQQQAIAEQRSKQKLLDVMNYAEATAPGCRMQLLSHPFDGTTDRRCGRCDLCLGKTLEL